MAFSVGPAVSALGQLQDALKQTASLATSTNAAVSEHVGSTSQRLADLRGEMEKTKAAQADLNDSLDEGHRRAADGLDDLIARVNDFHSEFSEEIKLQLDAIRVGGEQVDDFLTKFGDAVVVIDGHAKTIREILEGVDFKRYEHSLRDLIDQVTKGGAKLSDVLKDLKARGGLFADEISKTVEAFEQGKISLQRLLDFFNSIKTRFPDSTLSDLLTALEQGLLSGKL